MTRALVALATSAHTHSTHLELSRVTVDVSGTIDLEGHGANTRARGLTHELSASSYGVNGEGYSD